MKPNYRARCARINRLLSTAYGQPAWPGPTNPLEVLIRTILLQLTSASGAEKAFNAVKDHYKTLEKVGEASVDSLTKVLKSGGLAVQKSKQLIAIIKGTSKRTS